MHRRAVRLVEVLQNRLCIALVQPVEVGGDQIRFPAVCVLFPAGFQFFRLGNDSPLDSLRCVEQQVKQVVRPLFQPCHVVAAGEEFVQQSTGGGHDFCHHQCAVLVQRQEREILRLSLACADNGIDCLALFQNLPRSANGVTEPVFLVIGEGFRPTGLPFSGIVCPFPHQNRRNTLKSLQQSLGKFSRFGGQHCQHLFRCRL